MNALSLFDGISCGQVALKRAGIKVKQYYASEIDANAIKVTQDNFPQTIQIGDVRTINGSTLPKIHILLAGPPCQGFKPYLVLNLVVVAKEKISRTISCLYYEFLRLLKEVKPTYWLLENVKGKNDVREQITNDLGIEPLTINSSLVSAQTRFRNYWTNIPGVSMSLDRGIVLGHVIEDTKKTYTMKTGHKYSQSYNPEPLDRQPIVKNNSTLRRQIRKALGNSMYKDTFGWRWDKFGRIVVTYPLSNKGKGGTKIQLVGAIAFMDNKTECIACVTQPHMIDRKFKVRKLIEEECEELQTLPRGYTKAIASTARYAAIGN